MGFRQKYAEKNYANLVLIWSFLPWQTLIIAEDAMCLCGWVGDDDDDDVDDDDDDDETEVEVRLRLISL